MRQLTINTLILLCTFGAFAQHDQDRYLLKTDSLWGKEIFKLPTRFAQKMTFNGFEDASFPRGWSNKESSEFWSYIFAWSISEEKTVSIQKIEANLDLYFDGLMDVSIDSLVPGKLPSTSLLVKTNKTDRVILYAGKVRTFDRFSSNKMMILHLKAEQYACETSNRNIVVFRFSPKEFNHPVWDKLNAVRLIDNACEKD